MSAYEPIIKNGVMIFELREPIYNSTYSIWDKWLKVAKDKGYKLVVVTKFGTSTYPSYKEWVTGAKRLERFYKNPDVPMIMFSRDVVEDVKARDKRKAEEKKKTESVGMNKILSKVTPDEKNALRVKLGLKPL